MKTKINIMLLSAFLGFNIVSQAQTASDKNNYYIFLESGAVGDNKNASLSIQFSNGIGLSDIFYIGLGVGIDIFNDYLSIPTFLDVKASLAGNAYTTAWSPYYYVAGGHTFVGARENIKGGIFSETGFGLSFGSGSDRMSLTLKLGYRAQDIITQESSSIIHSFVARIGFVYR